MTGAWGRCGIHFLLLWRPERVSSDGGLFWLLFGAALPPALPSFLLTEGGRRIRRRWGQGQGPQQEAPVPSSFLRAASEKPGAQPPRAGVRWGGPRAAERGGGSPAQPALPPGGAGCPPAGERGSSWCPLPPRVPPGPMTSHWSGEGRADRERGGWAPRVPHTHPRGRLR